MQLHWNSCVCFVPSIFISLFDCFFLLRHLSYSGRDSFTKLQLLPSCPSQASSRPFFAALPTNHCHLVAWSWRPSVTMVTADLWKHTHLCYPHHLLVHIFPLVAVFFLVLGTWSAKSLGWELPKVMNKRCKIYQAELCEKYIEK